MIASDIIYILIDIRTFPFKEPTIMGKCLEFDLELF
jgi:hypothetical protein